MSTIIQIIPAQPGWVAAYLDGTADDGAYLEPIVCWALVEVEGRDRRVVALLDFGADIDEPSEGAPLGYFPSELAARRAVAHHLAVTARLDAGT